MRYSSQCRQVSIVQHQTSPNSSLTHKNCLNSHRSSSTLSLLPTWRFWWPTTSSTSIVWIAWRTKLPTWLLITGSSSVRVVLSSTTGTSPSRNTTWNSCTRRCSILTRSKYWSFQGISFSLSCSKSTNLKRSPSLLSTSTQLLNGTKSNLRPNAQTLVSLRRSRLCSSLHRASLNYLVDNL